MVNVAGHKTFMSLVEWKPCWRLVSSRFPPIGLFDRVANTDELEAVFFIEGLTNDRLREESGDLSLVPKKDRICGEGTTPIMSAFTHLNPDGSRFTDGSYGVYYAAKDIDTAIEETKFHKARFLAATNESPIHVDMRSYRSDISVSLDDVRAMKTSFPELYSSSTDEYSYPQEFAKKLKESGSNGIVYDSVRHKGGECIAIFRPIVLSPVKQGKHYCYVWDGLKIKDVYIKSKRS